jgi:PAS domain-containing protein
MVIVVAANDSEVMAPAETLASGAHSVALVATALILFVGGLVLWELYTIQSHRRQQRIFERNRAELERLRADEAANNARTQLSTAHLRIILDNAADGVALFDSGLRLVQWNHPFLRAIGIEPRQDMALDTMLREQAAKGLLGPAADTEAEIARRVGVLRTGDRDGLPQSGPNGESLTLHGRPVSEGGFVLLVNGVAPWQPVPRLEDVRPVPDRTPPLPIEW